MEQPEAPSLGISPDLANAAKTLGRLRAMLDNGLPFGEIARRLNALGIGPDESGRPWMPDDVREVRDTLPPAANDSA